MQGNGAASQGDWNQYAKPKASFRPLQYLKDERHQGNGGLSPGKTDQDILGLLQTTEHGRAIDTRLAPPWKDVAEANRDREIPR
jgi:hypothetical protein